MAKSSLVILLSVIYLAFISLGLPDSVLGVAWPAMRGQWGQPVEALGLITLVLTLCSAVSGFASSAVLKKLGTGPTVLLSGLLTGGALLGISLIPSFSWIFLLVLPLGFGAGSVDAGLNHFVAAHYSSRHMSWLHASWGIGAFLGPLLMGRAIGGPGWSSGYAWIGSMQLGLALCFLLSLPLWKKEEAKHRADADSQGAASPDEPAPRRSSIPAWAEWLAPALYLVYAALELGTGLWAATVLVEERGLDESRAATLVSAFYGSIMAGRFLNGFISDRLGNRAMVRAGLLVASAGAVVFAIPSLPLPLSLVGLALIGLGCAPVYPCLMHETPRRFDGDTARRVVGRQVGFNYVGAALIPAAFGLLGGRLGLQAIMPAVAASAILLLGGTEVLNRAT